MDNNTILHSYQDWLKVQKMPAGKKKTLSAAVELFSRQGYNGTSTAQIAEKASISQATIFKYFKTKEELLSEIIEPLIPELKKEFLPKLKTYSKIEDVVHFIVQNRFRFLAQNADIVKIILQEILVNSGLRQSLMAAIQDTIIDDLKMQLSRLQNDNPNIVTYQEDCEVIRTGLGLLFAYFFQRFVLEISTQSEEKDLKCIEEQLIKLITTKV